MPNHPRIARLRAAALATIAQRLDDLRHRDGTGPLIGFERARVGEALAGASRALSRERGALVPRDWPGEAAVPLAEARALLRSAAAALAPRPAAPGHGRNRALAEIPAHYAPRRTYPPDPEP
ncbi:hypothetical protein PRN20_04310 [Devosia sp. ZB163]|uniref:hypothetical protein n=1 Tax=Devosia sp. ZB163 TaxID=3025938 RepID=UPI0023600F6F|nr:hypothetical protein [Devosia sp. ZB163]MDC9822945.1 hypothetical protein [Devosia sp. ZB163]